MGAGHRSTPRARFTHREGQQGGFTMRKLHISILFGLLLQLLWPTISLAVPNTGVPSDANPGPFIRSLLENILVRMGGEVVIVTALVGWFGKVWANRILVAERARYDGKLEHVRSDLDAANRRIQSELDKTIHVHRVQFETEFKALRDVWSCVAGVRARIPTLRPGVDLVDPKEDPKKRLEKRFGDYQKFLNNLVVAVDYQSPFYPKEIHDALSRLVMIGKKEQIDISASEERNSDWFKRGKKNVDDFIRNADQLSDQIRARIARMSIVDNRR